VKEEAMETNTQTKIERVGESSLARQVPNRGIDTKDRRPGVPMELPPEPIGSIALVLDRQPSALCPVKRMELEVATPVYGTAQPPQGLSGAIRRAAYAVPEHRPSHWLMLMLADRVDVIEHDVTRLWWLPLAVPVAAFAIRKLARRRQPWWRRAFDFA
jgi:hypothetical protein